MEDRAGRRPDEGRTSVFKARRVGAPDSGLGGDDDLF